MFKRSVRHHTAVIVFSLRKAWFLAFTMLMLVLAVTSCLRLNLVPYQSAARLADIEVSEKMVDKLYFGIIADSIGDSGLSEFAKAQKHYIELQVQVEALRRSYAEQKKGDDFLKLYGNVNQVLQNNIEVHRLNDPMQSAELPELLRMQMQAALRALRKAELGLPSDEK